MADQVVTDSLGRKITIRELGPEDLLDLYECMGAAPAGNPGFVNLALMVWSVTDIDGVPSAPASKKEHLRQRAKVLKNEGMIAVQKLMFGDPDAPAPQLEHVPSETTAS